MEGQIEHLLIKFVNSGNICRANKGTITRGAIQSVSSCSDIAIPGTVRGGSVLFEEVEI